MSYNAIELAAYQPTDAILQPVHILRLPGELRAALEKLYRSGLSDRFAETTRTFPIKSLNTLLPLAAPDVLSAGSRVSIKDDVPWLYSLHQVDTELVRDLINIWSLGLKGDDEHRTTVAGLIDRAPMVWERIPLDLAGTATSPEGMTKPADHVYPLLPALLARQLRLEGRLTTGNGDRLSFMESPWRGHGAELVSWPPRQGLPEEPDSWFSYLITISIQTLPFQPSFRVHVRTGIRRWVTKVGAQGLVYTAGRSVSVYLAATTAWPGMTDVKSRLAVHRLRYDPKDARHAWHLIDQPHLLPQASLIRSPVDATELCREPLRFLTDSRTVRVAIPYNTSMGTHAVGAGLMAGDRVPFLKATDLAFADIVERVPDWQRQSSLPDKPSNHQSRPTFPTSLPKEERDRLAAEAKRNRAAETTKTRRIALQSVLSGGPFTARILWQEAATREALVEALRDVLGLDAHLCTHGTDSTGAMQTLTWSTPELKVVLELARAGDLCGGLGVAMERPTRTELGQAVAARRTAARATFEGQEAHAAIVEIDRVFKVTHDDPKFVIRLGSADAGVLTQFMQTADQDTRLAKERPHRARQSWLDLLRQLGSARVPQPVLSSRLGEDLQYIAVWAINRQRRSATNPRVWRPIAIRYRPFSAEPIEGWQDEDRCWAPYRSFLLWLAQDAKAQSRYDEYSEADKASDEDSRWSRDRRQRETMAFLRHLVAAQQGRPTVLLAHAQNFRSDWPWLGNTRMTMDRIDLGDGDVPVSLWGNELHVVRVRDSQGDETPQYYGAGGKHGLPAGMWAVSSDDDARLFYSSGERAVTGSNAAVGARKEGIRIASRDREVIDTGTPAYNPNLLELCVAARSADTSPAELASYVHQLRYAPELERWLTLPYPLHLAKKAGEYASPL